MNKYKYLRKSKREIEELKIRNIFPYKYFIIDYSYIYKRWELVNVDLDGEEDSGEGWYFILSAEDGKEYKRKIQDVYGVQDFKYLKEKVNKLNKKGVNRNVNKKM